MRKRSFKIAVFLLALAGFFGSVILIGRWARDQLRDRARYRLAFTGIEVDPPPGMTRDAFLEEVQYWGSMADAMSLVGPNVSERITQAFRRHPWVADVTSVTIRPRQIKVQLTYRRPVLAVRVGDSLRAVDGEGVVLPKEADTAGLPVYADKAVPPAGPPGSRWGDAGVEAMARVLGRAGAR
ncbi:MAG: hypothetical protein FJ271_17325 [Planctomycetes bacterium]|nr:hypothetical protein [Planctomycetota bacterium]